MIKQKPNNICICGSGFKFKKCCGNINKVKIIASSLAIDENNRLSNIQGIEFVQEYINLPYLPTNKEITIKQIGIYNWDTLKRCPKQFINYGIFTKINENEYPKGTNLTLDYMEDDYISPVIIIDNDNNKYKVKYILWIPLIDIHDGIIYKQYIIHKKILPYKIFIDDDKILLTGGIKNKWITELFNLIGTDILNKLKEQT